MRGIRPFNVMFNKPRIQCLEVPESAKYGREMWLCVTCPRCKWAIIWTPYVVKETKDRVYLTRKHLYYDKDTGKPMAPIHALECQHPKKKFWSTQLKADQELIRDEFAE